MNTLKHLVFENFRSLVLFMGCCFVPLLLLMVRIKITSEFFLLFLVWNLFLAAVPLLLSFWLQKNAQLKKWQLLFWSVVWILFLPNAPYILTDFIHLQLSGGIAIIIDFIVISSFAISGLLFYIQSVTQMEVLFYGHFSKKFTAFIILLLPFLCGFGIYLGRFLRWNSWDLLHHPQGIMIDVVTPLLAPLDNKLAWTVTLLFGFGLHISMIIYKSWNTKTTKSRKQR